MTWKMKGQYLKNCNCLATCPCDTIGVPAPDNFCEGVVAMKISEGHFDDVDLSGLTWAASVHWPGALHEGNGVLQPFIDVRATPAQREALLQILSGKAGGPYFEIIASIVTTVHEPQFVPIQFEFDKERRHARLSIPGFIETTSMPLTVPATGGEQHVTVLLPDGFEYKEMEVAQTGMLKSTGAIKFDYKNTNSSLAAVEHTSEGLAA